MTPRVRDFLEQAAECEHDKGILVGREYRQIAAKAVKGGYGWQITSPLNVFIITDTGRKALKVQP